MNPEQIGKKIVEQLLMEDFTEKVSLYPGAFKPPHRGHVSIALDSLETDTNKLILFISTKAREDVEVEEALKAWELYKESVPGLERMEIVPTPTPVKDVYDYVKNNPTHDIKAVFGKGEEDRYTSLAKKYPNVEIFNAGTVGNYSATDLRQAIRNKDKETIATFLPDGVNIDSFLSIFQIQENLNEIGDLSQEPYDWKADLNKTDKDDPIDIYNFTTDNGIQYQVVFNRQEGFNGKVNYILAFLAKGGGDQGYSTNALTGGNEPLKVMSTVVDIVKSHMEYKGDADFIIFSPTKGKTGEDGARESTRGKLYKLIIKKNFPKAKVHGADTVYADVSAYKGEDMFEAASPNSSYSFKVTDKTRDEEDNSLITVEYKFSTPDNTYRVEFYSGEYRPEDKTFDLSFGVDTGETNAIDTFQMTGEGNARKIFKTILNIVEDFLNKEDVEKIIVDGTSEKRKRIYKSIFSTSNLSDKVVVKEAVVGDKIVCDNCGWEWKIVDGGEDLYTCHKCWHDNTPRKNYLQEARYKKFLNEGWDNSKAKTINTFLEYCSDYLSITRPKIKLVNSPEYTQEYHSFGGYMPSEEKIIVVVHNRNMADILRTLAHEMVHHMQNLDDRLTPKSGEDGSPDENEANSLAGVIMREFGRNNPHIYE